MGARVREKEDVPMAGDRSPNYPIISLADAVDDAWDEARAPQAADRTRAHLLARLDR